MRLWFMGPPHGRYSMGEQRSSRSPSPHSVAAIASSLVLVVGLGVGTYFVELRGEGFQALMASSQALEVLILFGALAAIAITAHIAVAAAVSQSRSVSAYRSLVQRALEIDHSDPGILHEFAGVPELHDLVNMLMAEKSQWHELCGQIETLHDEISGLVSGMERSASSLGPMREEPLGEFGQKVTTLWNALVERVRAAEATSASAAEPSEPVELLQLDTDDVMVMVNDASAARQDIEVLSVRLGRLEHDLQRLRGPGGEGAPQAVAVESAAAEAKALAERLGAGTSPASDAPDAAARPQSPPRTFSDAVQFSGSSLRPETLPHAEPRGVDELARVSPAAPGAFGPQGRPVAGGTPVAAGSPRPGEPTPDAVRFSEWAGGDTVPGADTSASSAGMSPSPFQARDPERFGPQPDSRAASHGGTSMSSGLPSGLPDAGGPPRGSAPHQPSSFQSRPFAEPPGVSAAPPAEQVPGLGGREPRFEDLDFPHFVGRPVVESEDRVEVTYDTDPGQAPEELPDGSLLFEPEPDGSTGDEPVVDLRSLGAVEFKE
ncbi:MAG: hypothetical protein ACE5G2_10585 [Candidatus Krumholzibacteriia bacterium]